MTSEGLGSSSPMVCMSRLVLFTLKYSAYLMALV
jgi:hypothetical protein